MNNRFTDSMALTLSITGNEVYLNNIQGAIELFLSNDGPLVFPPLLIIDFAKKGSYGKL